MCFFFFAPQKIPLCKGANQLPPCCVRIISCPPSQSNATSASGSKTLARPPTDNPSKWITTFHCDFWMEIPISPPKKNYRARSVRQVKKNMTWSRSREVEAADVFGPKHRVRRFPPDEQRCCSLCADLTSCFPASQAVRTTGCFLSGSQSACIHCTYTHTHTRVTHTGS